MPMVLDFIYLFGSDVSWIEKNQEQLQRFVTVSFLEAMLTHLRKADALSAAEEARIKEAAELRDQINMLTTIIANKDNHGPSSVLLNFIESSESQVAKLIKHHGKKANIGFLYVLILKHSLTSCLDLSLKGSLFCPYCRFHGEGAQRSAFKTL